LTDLPFRTCRPGSRPRVPLPLGTRFSEPRRRLPTSATFNTTRGHTRRAFDPRTRVELSLRCSPAPTDASCVAFSMRCRIEGLRATTCTRQAAGRNAREKAMRVSRTIFAPALLVTLRAPGSPARLSAGSGDPAYGFAPAKIHLGCRLAKGNTVGRIKVPSTATEPLRDRVGYPFVRAGTAAPSRRLRGGIARGFARLLCPHRHRLPLTRKAMAAARLAKRR